MVHLVGVRISEEVELVSEMERFTPLALRQLVDMALTKRIYATAHQNQSISIGTIPSLCKNSFSDQQ